jgi:hypothetical protein
MWQMMQKYRVWSFVPLLALIVALGVLGVGIPANAVKASDDPTITSINPSRGDQGTTLDVTINGTNFTEVSAVIFYGDGITLNHFNVESTTRITANITIDANAGASLRNVSVQTSSGITFSTRGFGVTCQTGISVNGARAASTGVNQEFVLRLSASNLETFQGYDMTINYDTSVLEVVGTEGGTTGVTPGLIGSVSVPIADWHFSPSGIPGHVRVLGQVSSNTYPLGIAGGGYLAEVHLHVFGTVGQTSSLTISNIDIQSYLGESIPVAPPQNGSVTVVPAPTIATVSPSSGPVAGGTAITITGTNFVENQTEVSIGGVPAAGSVTWNSTTIIKAVTPAGIAGARNVVVTTPGGSATKTAGFSYLPLPAISSFSPLLGGTGTTVTINGANLSGATAVTIGGTAAAIQSNSATKITAVVGTGSTGAVAVTTPGGTATGADNFTYYLTPSISTINPVQGGSGTIVTINGANLTGATAVSFGSKAAASFNIISDTRIEATLGSGATGTVSITTPGGTATSAGNFTYYATPKITSFTPTSGGSDMMVTINGADLSGVTSVTIGGSAASDITVISAKKITAKVGSGATGKIVVTTPGGTAASSKSFTYYGSPSIMSFSPSSGGKNSLVNITGANFSGASKVLIGGVKAASFKVDSSTQITAKAGSGATGVISVTTPGGTTTSADSFTYYGIPRITSLNPISGGKGTKLTIKGTNFDGVSAVKIGVVATYNFTFDSSTQITAIAGEGAPGKVSVTTPGGTGSSSAKFNYYYQPVISDISPDKGGNGTSVTITGDNLKGATLVTFGGTPAASFKLVGAKIIAKAGAGSSGKVSVTTPGGTAESTKIFTYYPAPAITSFSPNVGGKDTVVTIAGFNLTDARSVYFGSKPAASFNFTDTRIMAVVGSGATGVVKVTTYGGSVSSTSKFTFYPAPKITSFTPTAGPGGTSVTISGSNFVKGATEVKFGDTPAASVSVTSTSKITAVTGDGTAGKITVKTPGGTATSTGSFSFGAILSVNAPLTAAAGGEFKARINISQVSDLAGYQFNITYDPAVINVPAGGVAQGKIGTQDFPLDGWAFIPTGAQGTITLFGHISQFSKPPSLSGTGYLAEITFNVVGNAGAHSSIAISAISLINSTFNPAHPQASNILTDQPVNATVNITAP